MGKSKQLKKMRRLAQDLPTLQTTRMQSEIVTGREVIDNGVTELTDGTAIDPKGRYTRKHPVKVALNYKKALKKNYYKGGMPLVMGYIGVVQQHAQTLKEGQKNKLKAEDLVQTKKAEATEDINEPESTI